MTSPIAFLPIFMAKKSRRKKITEAMLPMMIPLSDPTQQMAMGAITADNAVRSEERAEERIASEVVNTIEKTSQDGELSEQTLSTMPRVKAVFERRPELRRTIEVCASRLVSVTEARLAFDMIKEDLTAAGEEFDLDKLKQRAPIMYKLLRPKA
jgi:hypothetical protein